MATFARVFFIGTKLVEIQQKSRLEKAFTTKAFVDIIMLKEVIQWIRFC